MDEDHLMRRLVAWRSIRCGRGPSSAPGIGPIPASKRIWPDATTGSCGRRRSSSGRRASPTSSTRDADDPAFAALRRSELIGRPLGDAEFQDAIGRRLNRAVTPGKRGRKPRTDARRSEAKG
jgi:putative transposase